MGAIFQQVGALDEAWIRGVAAHRAPRWLDRAFRYGTHLGGATATLAVGVFLVLLPETRQVGLAALIANSASHILSQLLKRRFLRRRPHLVCDALDPLIPIPDAWSFPSGHACAATAVGAAVALGSDVVIAIPAVAAAVFVAASRVYLRVHFVSDVLIGGLLGLAGALVGWSIVGG
jgi:undecaprenyl-diphosphatase